MTFRYKMVLIEGIGDELTICVIVAVIAILIISAWQSTFVNDGRRGNHAAEDRITESVTIPNTEQRREVETVQVTLEEKNVKKDPDDIGKREAEKSNVRTTETNAETPSTSYSEPNTVPSTVSEEQILTTGVDSLDPQQQTNGIPKSEVTDTSDVNVQEQHGDSRVGRENRIYIKVKFLNDTDREIETALTETIGDLRRNHFRREVESGHRVRFIFNGHVLATDNLTLDQCGIRNNSIIHCLLSAITESDRHQSGNNSYPALNDPLDADLEIELGRYVMPIFGAILMSIWYFRLEYDEYFNNTSTFSLSLLTALYGLGLYLVRRGVWGEENNSRNQERNANNQQ